MWDINAETIGFGQYPALCAASSTSLRVEEEIRGLPLNAIETVDWATPSNLAISRWFGMA